MDTPKPPQKPAQLLHDLESIRELLGDESQEPPLLIDSLDPDSIPVLSDIVSAPPGPPPPFHVTPTPKPAPATQTAAAASPTAGPLRERLEPRLHDSARELQHLNAELRAAAQLILQDVIDDFVPQIEAELKRRLEARLPRLLPPRKP
ncbi:MAG: DNA polymerase III subunit chi [Pseudomonas sp.]|uniref:DNA polymerase III subunit chi n=1 Tax=Ectopseudomonas hydrolytica TaxID=2493633 RepID=UPI0023540536|nr:DNA polymerase III subunit chi [Pseudomonas sp.]MBA4246498.1 DNA polymerase III subunit chi [Pseudomonas sp.]